MIHTLETDPDTRRAWVDVDLDALVANAASYQRQVGVPILPMIKANGYGLGAVAVARALGGNHVWGFGVATIDEAIELRRAAITAPIIVFAPLQPAWIAAWLDNDLRPVIGDLAALDAWCAAGNAPFHVEFDTGMHRSGFLATDTAMLTEAGRLLRGASGFEGAFGHFHSAGSDDIATESQWRLLHQALEVVGVRPRLVHASNSAGGGYGKRYAGDLARPGVHLYGGRVPGLETRPVAALRARVTATRRIGIGKRVGYDAVWQTERETTIATIAVGYADGVPRQLSLHGNIEIANQQLPIAGSISMDQLMVDVGDLAVQPGDIATVYGGSITLDQQADLAGTISYALLTALGTRLPRRYHRSL